MLGMKEIEKVKLVNFRRFPAFEYTANSKRNIFIGDNESGKSTILQAIDLVLNGSRNRIETLGLESLFYKGAVNEFLAGEKRIEDLPELKIEIFLNDFGNQDLEGLNHTEHGIRHGLKLECKPMDEYGTEINAALEADNPLFPFEYYSIQFSTFAGFPYTQNRRFMRHIFIDSSLIGTEHATRHYTKSLYEANTDIVHRHKNHHAYRQSKSEFTIINLAELNNKFTDTKFEIKNDSKSNIDQDLMITDRGIPVSQMGKGNQCFIKTEFALRKKEDADPIDLILIEEPENHLSPVKMKKLLSSLEEASATQIMIATHSNSICSRLDLHNASILSPDSTTPIPLKDLPNETANFFVKAPDNKILEFVLAKKVVLVEGDAEYILIEAMYENLFNEKLEDSEVHVISVGGTSFKRYMDLAKLLNIKTAVIRDNDGDFQRKCVENYEDYVTDLIRVFYDEDNEARSTLELCVFRDNEELCIQLFSEGRKTLSVLEYMLANKADAALKLLEEGGDKIQASDYIVQALTWIKE
jgi:putative ATP-dependent endonuclease of the OLD family